MTSTSLHKPITIISTFADSEEAMQSCKDESGALTRHFFDWYLEEEKPKFIIDKGVMLLDHTDRGFGKGVIYFDFTDPDEVTFDWFPYGGKYPIAKWRYYRQDNLTISNIDYELDFFHTERFWQYGEIGMNKSLLKMDRDLYKRKRKINTNDENLKRQIMRINKRTEEKHEMVKDAAISAITYYVYAFMYKSYCIEPEIIESDSVTTYMPETERTERKKYYYTGYVNLNDTKAYKIKKDTNAPVREYERHIEKWIVRGHYRRTKNGLIWIDEHVKGQGETIEKRIYGTTPESEVNIYPKVFEVEKKVSVKDVPPSLIRETIDEMIADGTILKKKKGLLKRGWDLIVNLFKPH